VRDRELVELVEAGGDRVVVLRAVAGLLGRHAERAQEVRAAGLREGAEPDRGETVVSGGPGGGPHDALRVKAGITGADAWG
jgi:hypothetical protein